MSQTGSSTPIRQPPWPAPLAAPLPPGRFKKNEEWAWARIANGMDADMASYPGDDVAPDSAGYLEGKRSALPDPKTAESYKDQHILSELFLRTILFHEPWTSAPERTAVRIFHARIVQPLDWSSRKTRGALWFFRCRLESEVNFDALHVQGLLSLETCNFNGKFSLLDANVREVLSLRSSVFQGEVQASRMSIGGGIFCDNSVFHKNFLVSGARVGSAIDFTAAKLHGDFDATNVRLESDLFFIDSFEIDGAINLIDAQIGGVINFSDATLRGELNAQNVSCVSTFFFGRSTAEKAISLRGAQIGAGVSFDGSTLKGELNAEGIRIAQGLFCRDGFVGETIRLLEARIGGETSFVNGSINGELNATSINIAGLLLIRQMKRLGNADLMGARISQDLQIRESVIDGRLDLTGAIISGELHLDKGWDAKRNTDTLPTWTEKASLILRNTQCDAIAGRLDAFRRNRNGKKSTRHDFVDMDLTGFKYERLGGLFASHKDTLAAANGKDLVKWLEAGCGDGAFNPGPYRQLARVLDESGDTGAARQIMHAMARHEHGAAQGWRKFGFGLSWLFIDYGFSSRRAVGWFALLVALYAAWGLNMHGMRPLEYNPQSIDELLRWLGFSFGNAVPLISFDKAHDTFLAEQFGALGADNRPDPASVPPLIAWAFYGQKALGFVILSYLAAGLSGLARRGLN